jgi:hypothetical protein
VNVDVEGSGLGWNEEWRKYSEVWERFKRLKGNFRFLEHKRQEKARNLKQRKFGYSREEQITRSHYDGDCKRNYNV